MSSPQTEPGRYRAPQHLDDPQKHTQASESQHWKPDRFTSPQRVAGQANLGHTESGNVHDDPAEPRRYQSSENALLQPSDRSTSRRLLDTSYKLRDHPTKFFKFGKVFLSLWIEPSGAHSRNESADSESSMDEDGFPVAFEERAFAKVRRFIVVRPMMQSSVCVAISTHSGQGVARIPGMSFQHAIVHTGRVPPLPRPGEAGAEFLASIRVDSDVPGQELHPASRVNFGKVYTVEHNIKVKPYGVVNQYSMGALAENFNRTFDLKQLDAKTGRLSKRPESTNNVVPTVERAAEMEITCNLQTSNGKHLSSPLFVGNLGRKVPLLNVQATPKHDARYVGHRLEGKGDTAEEKIYDIHDDSKFDLQERKPLRYLFL
jgi:hypothetical protein